MGKVVMDGKGFGGGEATRDPEPTWIDPNDPKGKQQAIFKAESFAEYLARPERPEGQAAGDLQGRVLRRVPGAPQGRRRWRDRLGCLSARRDRVFCIRPRNVACLYGFTMD